VNDPILVTGISRSGASMIAGIINLCGAFGGGMVGQTRYDRKGVYENTNIRNNIVKRFLREIAADSLGQYPLPDIFRCLHIAPTRKDYWKKSVVTAMQNDGYTEGQPWFYKDAKTCLIWPIWKEAFPEAKWVIVSRKDKDVIASCLRTGFMKAYSDARGWQSWIDEHRKRFTEMESAGIEGYEVWPEDLIEGDLTVAKQLIEWCGLEWQRDKVAEFIGLKLWKEELI